MKRICSKCWADGVAMNGYQQAILYLNGVQQEERFCVRNIDRWYIDAVADCFPGYQMFLQKRKAEGKKDYWCIKSPKVTKPPLSDVSDLDGFARAFIELQGYLLCFPYYCKKRNRSWIKRKLCIYGAHDDLLFIQPSLPARQREPIECNTVNGRTFCLLYQSKEEIGSIIEHFRTGIPCNTSFWDHWAEILR